MAAASSRRRGTALFMMAAALLLASAALTGAAAVGVPSPELPPPTGAAYTAVTAAEGPQPVVFAKPARQGAAATAAPAAGSALAGLAPGSGAPTASGAAAVAPTAVGPTAAASTASTGTAPASSEEKFSLIIVFREASTLARLRVMCAPSPLIYRLFARGLRLPAECHLQGVCKRIYSQTVSGFSGEFAQGDLARLERCLPGSIFYKEPDAQVYKAEDSSYWHPADPSSEQQQPQQQPPQQPSVQQQQQRRRASGRRMQQLVMEAPRVQAFEERTRTPASESGPIQPFSIAQGLNMSRPGVKKETVSSRLWNLDRLDQRELPLDGSFSYGSAASAGTGKGATIYVVDSGIRPSHQEFRSADGSRLRASHGFDFVEDDASAEDCDGHGTHVAGTAIGLQVGVAKEAEVVAVRILDCTGSGTISDTVAGLDWVAANYRKPAVVTLSLGIQVGSWSRVLEDAVRSLITKQGITVVVASGNSGVDACYVAPANVPEVITVAASNLATKYNGSRAGDAEDIYRWSNTGPCLDLFAPGVDVFSACGGPSRCEVVGDEAYSFASGTSMAVPHVAGVAAVYLGDHPNASPLEVQQFLNGGATQGKIASAKLRPGTPNRLLFSGGSGGSGGGGTKVQAASGLP